MHRLFGRAKPAGPAAPPPPSLSEHIATLEDRGVSMDAKIGECDRQLAGIKAQLAKCKTEAQKAPLKQRAMAILKRKKMYEQHRDSMVARASNMERTQFAIDSVKQTKDHVAVMRAGVTTMKAEMKEIDIDDLEDLTDDMADLLADQSEIDEVLTRSYDVSDTVNEADLDAELAGLDDELGTEDATGVGAGAAAAATPAAPVGTDADLAAYLTPSLAPAAGGGGAAAAARFPAVPTGELPASRSAVPIGTAARF